MEGASVRERLPHENKDERIIIIQNKLLFILSGWEKVKIS
jgi:hypothetical protein